MKFLKINIDPYPFNEEQAVLDELIMHNMITDEEGREIGIKIQKVS